MMKKRKIILFSVLMILSFCGLSACGGQTTSSAKRPILSSKSVVKKSTYSQVKNQTINNALRAYPTLADFDKALSYPALKALHIDETTRLIKLSNNGKAGGWIIVKKGTPDDATVSTDKDGKPVKANDSRGATVGEIRQAFKSYKR
ncbi:hypothetical protein [Lactococcus kimchii]|uniref:hypothetical protein n=1 Tax=Lactococcus sp. S-13 TaxID=2507158 RepID=UPI001023D2CD|nr:hypothetical protein [Lactococcus sp. S-13]RZI49172.1 hypothetical protein EQJ87_06815 [Lactococcus sp. S-13]